MVIAVRGVGVDMVDVDSATEAGIVVTNIPDVFIEEVADHAMFLLLSAIRRGKIMDNMVCRRRGEKDALIFINKLPRRKQRGIL